MGIPHLLGQVTFTSPGLYILAQIVIAVICAGIANILIPRRIPGKLFGLVAIGFAGVWLGEWGYRLMYQSFGLYHPVLQWNLAGVPIIPAIIGSAIVLYLVTMVLSWWKYGS